MNIRFALAMVIFMCGVVSTVHAATCASVVDTVSDDSSSSTTSLRDAVDACKASGDTITFSSSLNDQIIRLVDDSIVIGSGETLVLEATDQNIRLYLSVTNFTTFIIDKPVFDIQSGGSLEINGLILDGLENEFYKESFIKAESADVTLNDVVVTQHYVSNASILPALMMIDSNLTVTDSEFTELFNIKCDSACEKGSANISEHTAGIYFLDTVGGKTLTVDSSYFGLNFTQHEDGIASSIIIDGQASTTANITNSSFHENFSFGYGSAIGIAGAGNVTIEQCSFAENIASQNGALYLDGNASATVNVNHSSFLNNVSNTDNTATSIFEHSLFSGTLNVDHTAFVHTSSNDHVGSIDSGSFTHSYLSSDQKTVFLPMNNYGGGVPALYPIAGSAIVDAGDAGFAGSPSTDQRGFARVYNSRIDIGANEYGLANAILRFPFIVSVEAGSNTNLNLKTLFYNADDITSFTVTSSVPSGFSVSTAGILTASPPSSLGGQSFSITMDIATAVDTSSYTLDYRVTETSSDDSSSSSGMMRSWWLCLLVLMATLKYKYRDSIRRSQY